MASETIVAQCVGEAVELGKVVGRETRREAVDHSDLDHRARVEQAVGHLHCHGSCQKRSLRVAAHQELGAQPGDGRLELMRLDIEVTAQ